MATGSPRIPSRAYQGFTRHPLSSPGVGVGELIRCSMSSGGGSMTRIDRCLSQIHAVRDVAAGIDPPYVARSRIGRLAMSTGLLVAEAVGTSAPVLPGPIWAREDSSPEIAALAGCCNRVTELARHISQPSEPLDARWRRGWNELLRELRILEEHLESLRERRSDS